MLRVRELRRARGWSQMDLAVKLDPPRHPRIISSWENAHCMPRPETLRELAQVFGVSIGELFDDKPVIKEAMKR